MGIEWIVGGVFGLLGMVFSGVFGVLGTVVGGLPGGGALSGGIVVGYSWLNTFLPVSETAAGVVWILALYTFLFGYRVIREVWNMVPFVGGHG